MFVCVYVREWGRWGGAQLVLVLRCSDGSVAACARASVAGVVDVEEGLGLAEGPPPLVHVVA